MSPVELSIENIDESALPSRLYAIVCDYRNNINLSILLKLDYCMFVYLFVLSVCLLTKGLHEKDRGEKAHLQFR